MDFAVYPFKRETKYRLYVKFTTENGKQKALSTGITYPLDANKKERKKAKKEAERKAIDILMEHFQDRRHIQEKKKDEEKSNAIMLSDYLEEHYWPHVASNCEDSTLVSYQGALDHFIRIIGDKPLDEYKRKLISDYKIHRLNKENIAKTTINIEIRSIKAAFSWAHKHDFIKTHPYRGQEFLFDVKEKKREFKKYEVEKLIKQTEGTHIGLAIKLAYFTGMRIGEMSQLKWKLVNMKESYIFIPEEITKKKERMVPLGKKAYYIVKMLGKILDKKMEKAPDIYKNVSREECYLLQKERGHGQYSRRSIQQKFRKEMNKAGLPKELTFHCLRHSFATHILEKPDASILGVSKLLGHTTTNVTLKFYVHTDALNYRHIANMI